ncbi:hypothetical protein L2E82_16750 [Cichorium intybus]|uniref:Uncharacterized protein n=1 Tax=Cichorium intybus TaxID=13427 RepID=A0ACB9F708_CICIN|nr:hypothetical protein L2E82_16750 [Cichorium intybus]
MRLLRCRRHVNSWGYNNPDLSLAKVSWLYGEVCIEEWKEVNVGSLCLCIDIKSQGYLSDVAVVAHSSESECKCSMFHVHSMKHIICECGKEIMYGEVCIEEWKEVNVGSLCLCIDIKSQGYLSDVAVVAHSSESECKRSMFHVHSMKHIICECGKEIKYKLCLNNLVTSEKISSIDVNLGTPTSSVSSQTARLATRVCLLAIYKVIYKHPISQAMKNFGPGSRLRRYAHMVASWSGEAHRLVANHERGITMHECSSAAL